MYGDSSQTMRTVYTENINRKISMVYTVSGDYDIPTVTVNVNDDLKGQMESHPEINWSEVARSAFEEKVEDLEMMERLSTGSELTEEDIDELAELIDSNVAKKLASRSY
jgi:hypothetical protein